MKKRTVFGISVLSALSAFVLAYVGAFYGIYGQYLSPNRQKNLYAKKEEMRDRNMYGLVVRINREDGRREGLRATGVGSFCLSAAYYSCEAEWGVNNPDLSFGYLFADKKATKEYQGRTITDVGEYTDLLFDTNLKVDELKLSLRMNEIWLNRKENYVVGGGDFPYPQNIEINFPWWGRSYNLTLYSCECWAGTELMWCEFRFYGKMGSESISLDWRYDEDYIFWQHASSFSEL